MSNLEKQTIDRRLLKKLSGNYYLKKFKKMEFSNIGKINEALAKTNKAKSTRNVPRAILKCYQLGENSRIDSPGK